MNSSVRQQLNNALEELARLYPDWRYGQLLSNVATWAKGPVESATWDATDEELLAAALAHLGKHRSGSRKTA
jgi:hypothetical protein